MTATPHDCLFKAAFETPAHAASYFRCVLPPAVTEAIAWDTVSLEPGSFVDPVLAKSHSDLLFSAELGRARALLYLLFEHQSTGDGDMPLRMLIYITRILERFRRAHPRARVPIVLPLLISHVPGGWRDPVAFEDLLDPRPDSIPGLATYVPHFSILVDDLAHLSNEDLQARVLQAFPKLALWLLRDARSAETLFQNLEVWGDALVAAWQAPDGLTAMQQLLRYIALVTDQLQLERFRAKLRQHAPAVEEVAMATIAEQLRREGRAEGHAEGQRSLLRKLLALKFGELTAKQDARINAATSEEVDRYAERVLTADSIDAVLVG